jgi:hypothetical protein
MQDLTIWTGWGRSTKKVKNTVVLTVITHQTGSVVPQNRHIVIGSSMGKADDIIAQFRPGCIIHAQGMVFVTVTDGKAFLHMKPSFVYVGHTKYMADNPRKQQEQNQEDESLLSELSTVCLHKPVPLENEEQMQYPTNHLHISDDRAE